MLTIVNNNDTKYQILVKKDSSSLVAFAVNEFSTFMEKATGITFKKVSTVKKDVKYISFGDTKLLDLSKKQGLNSSGVLCYVENENIIISGGSDSGIVYSTYDLLKKLINLTFYAKDEIYYKDKKSIFIEEDYLNKYNPSIEYRQLGMYDVSSDNIFMNRVRTFGTGYTLSDYRCDWWKGIWGEMFIHTTFTILPPEKDDNGNFIHKNWYSENVEQLCLTNEEMTNAFIKNFKKHILNHLETKFFSLSIEDNWSYCKCPKCQESYKKYGLTGTYLIFAKKIVEAINEWRKTACPDATFKIVLCAYNWTRTAPVHYDNKLKKLIANDEKFVFGDDAIILNAPIDSCGYHSVTAPCNENINRRFEDWHVLCNEMFVWDYHQYFDNYMLFCPTIYSYKDNLQQYVKANVRYIYNECGAYEKSVGFQDLKTYLFSNLNWNHNLNVNKLIDDFMNNYYKVASKEMKQLLQLYYKNYEKLEKQYAKWGDRGYHTSYDVVGQPDILTERHWPKKFIIKCDKLLNKAVFNVNNSNLNKEEKEKLTKRIHLEQVGIKYLNLVLYTYYENNEQLDSHLKEFTDLVEELGLKRMTHWRGLPYSRTIQAFVDKIHSRYPYLSKK